MRCCGGEKPTRESSAVDPVCHMSVDEKTAKWKSEFGGRTYYFCAPGCKAAFEKNPEKYMK